MLNDIINIILYPVFGIPLKIWFFIGTGLAIMFQIKFANITYFIDSLKYAFSKKKQSDSINSGVGAITALMSQLAGNLGVGNFAGSAFGLYYGGPGVIIWFFILSFFCSSIKFAEVVLAHKFRTIENGNIKGGLFYVIQNALNIKYSYRKIMAILSALSVLIIAVSSASMQFNQISNLFFSKNGILIIDFKIYIFTIIVAISIAVILFGGLKKIGFMSDILVPIMGILYIGSCLIAIILYRQNILSVFYLVYDGFFNFKSGIIATIVVSLNRIISSTDTGSGFAAISQSNSNVKVSGQQGLISFFDPFIVALIMAIGAFAILVVGVDYNSDEFLGLLAIKQVFISVNPQFEYILILIAFMFGFTTIMACGFYMQESCVYLFGLLLKKVYIIIYILVYSFVALHDTKAIFIILDIAYSIGLINLVAMILLLPQIKSIWKDYLSFKDL